MKLDEISEFLVEYIIENINLVYDSLGLIRYSFLYKNIT